MMQIEENHSRKIINKIVILYNVHFWNFNQIFFEYFWIDNEIV